MLSCQVDVSLCSRTFHHFIRGCWCKIDASLTCLQPSAAWRAQGVCWALVLGVSPAPPCVAADRPPSRLVGVQQQLWWPERPSCLHVQLHGCFCQHTSLFSAQLLPLLCYTSLACNWCYRQECKVQLQYKISLLERLPSSVHQHQSEQINIQRCSPGLAWFIGSAAVLLGTTEPALFIWLVQYSLPTHVVTLTHKDAPKPGNIISKSLVFHLCSVIVCERWILCNLLSLPWNLNCPFWSVCVALNSPTLELFSV